MKNNIVILAFAAFLFITTEMKAVQFEDIDCWAAADAAETQTCGEVGCDFSLWEIVYTACMGYELEK